MRNFRELIVWQKSMVLTERIYKATANLPDLERYSLQSQLRRAAISIPSNIAEGCGCDSNPATKRYFSITLGSAYECETQMLLVERLGYAPINSLIEEIEAIQEVQKILSTFIKRLS